MGSQQGSGGGEGEGESESESESEGMDVVGTGWMEWAGAKHVAMQPALLQTLLVAVAARLVVTHDAAP